VAAAAAAAAVVAVVVAVGLEVGVVVEADSVEDAAEAFQTGEVTGVGSVVALVAIEAALEATAEDSVVTEVDLEADLAGTAVMAIVVEEAAAADSEDEGGASAFKVTVGSRMDHQTVMEARRLGVRRPDMAGEVRLVGTAEGADLVEEAVGSMTSSEKELAATMTGTRSGLGDISELLRKVKRVGDCIFCSGRHGRPVVHVVL